MEFWISAILVSALWVYYQHKVAPKEKAEKAAYQAVAEGAKQMRLHAGKLKRKPCGENYKPA